ncbi:hypothetical protein AX15_005743 [Amanita polypyramis BW_CC]|nr:hypothetical protein AX15_005743 [Amanita polypyramis BW_CC]
MVAWLTPLRDHTTSRYLRALSTPPPQSDNSHLTMERYHKLSDATLDILLESLEELLDALGRPDCEVEYHSGVLTLTLGEKGTYVINKQPPNKQIWLSSPFSGPKRYDYSEEAGNWIYSRDNQSMGDLLNDELSRVLEKDVVLRMAKVSESVP